MRKLISLILLTAVLMSAAVYAAEDEPVYDEIERTVNGLNEIREIMGLPSFKVSETLKIMAGTHTKYMTYNNRFSIVEESDKEYFRGRYPWDRAVYYQYGQDYVYEFILKDVINYQDGIDEIIADPVSRSVIFDPMYNEIGMNIDEGLSTVDVGGSGYEGSSFYTYPYNKQIDVPVSWQGDNISAIYGDKEMPDGSIGFPITVNYYGGDIESVRNLSIKLTNKNTGRMVDFDVIEPGEYYLLINTLSVLPKEPLEYDTDYELEVRYSIIDNNERSNFHHRTYEFTTVENDFQTVKSSFITRGRFTELLIRNDDSIKLLEPLEFRFTDVDISTPQSIYIYTASYEGLIEGFPDGTFGPELNITKDQAYTIIVKAFEKNNEDVIITDESILNKYKDKEDIKPWAVPNIMKAAELGILLEEDGTIDPNGYLTEAEFNRILSLFNTNTANLLP